MQNLLAVDTTDREFPGKDEISGRAPVILLYPYIRADYRIHITNAGIDEAVLFLLSHVNR